MRIALAQAAGVPADVAANLAAVRRTAADAAAGGARLVVFPEAFLTGYTIGPDPGAIDRAREGHHYLRERRPALYEG